MEPFTFKTRRQQISQPLIRLNLPYYRLLCRIKDETGLSLGSIIEQCIDYALTNSGDWESKLLIQYTQTQYPAGCPLLEQDAKEGGPE